MEGIREVMHPSISRPAADRTQETFCHISVASIAIGCIIQHAKSERAGNSYDTRRYRTTSVTDDSSVTAPALGEP